MVHSTFSLSRFCVVLAAFAGVAFLNGCAGAQPTAYQAADPDGFGYTEFVREDGVVIVTYRANGITAVPDVERYAMCRAAEIVATKGLPMFAVVDRQTTAVAGNSVTECVPGAFGTATCATHTASRPIVTLAVRPLSTNEGVEGAVYTSGTNFKRCQREQ